MKQRTKPYRVKITVDIAARDRDEAERRTQLLYGDLEAAQRPWILEILGDGIEELRWIK